MEIKLQLKMDKLLSDKGFTLLEMILVLSVVCVLLLFGGAIVSKNKTAFIYQMKIIRENITETQIKAVSEKDRKQIQFLSDRVLIDDKILKYPKEMQCSFFGFSFYRKRNDFKSRYDYLYNGRYNKKDGVSAWKWTK